MALTALEIYKHLPKTNCRECGFPTCLAFAMQLAAKRASLDQCPHVSEEARAALEGASAPPMRLVTIGAGDKKKLEIGNETVLFRHEEKFYHPVGIAVEIRDELSDEDKVIVARARRIQMFLTQPFFTAEQFTNVPGRYVKLEDTIRGFKMIIEGKCDTLPEQALYMVGTIEEAFEKAGRK